MQWLQFLGFLWQGGPHMPFQSAAPPPCARNLADEVAEFKKIDAAAAQQLVDSGKVFINFKAATSKTAIKAGDIVEVFNDKRSICQAWRAE